MRVCGRQAERASVKTSELGTGGYSSPRLLFRVPPRMLFFLQPLGPPARSKMPGARFSPSLTCVFLASKTEEQITNVNLLAKATGRDELQILGKELTLLQVGERRVGVAKVQELEMTWRGGGNSSTAAMKSHGYCIGRLT